MDVKKSPCPLTKGELTTRHRMLDEALVVRFRLLTYGETAGR